MGNPKGRPCCSNMAYCRAATTGCSICLPSRSGSSLRTKASTSGSPMDAAPDGAMVSKLFPSTIESTGIGPGTSSPSSTCPPCSSSSSPEPAPKSSTLDIPRVRLWAKRRLRNLRCRRCWRQRRC